VSGKTRLPVSALSTYRAHMMLVTVLAILAVDFPVFPRALAKCESFGVSFVRPAFRLFFTCNILWCSQT
jgi:phosphatidylinositol glycan class W